MKRAADGNLSEIESFSSNSSGLSSSISNSKKKTKPKMKKLDP